MTAKRFKLRLFKGTQLKTEVEDHLDPGDDARLRELLVELTRTVTRGGRVDLADGWKVEIWGSFGVTHHATVSVDGAGRTVVTRR